MKYAYKISPALAWQSYDCIDMLFILNRKNRNFYFFRDSGRFIVEHMLQMHPIQDVFEYCKGVYDVSDNDLTSAINHFVELLLREELIYEPDAET
ncbi:MAG: hypothetical protein PHI32_10900 [Dysgonamonadaceae bacterium]|nr:hypothetical protein [Dysgonamonadaceae bacterium]